MRSLSDIVLNRAPLIRPVDTTVQRACQDMYEHRLGSILIVTERERLAGIFTGRDAVHRVIADARDPVATRIGDVMTPNPVIMTPDKTAIDALRLMWDGGFRHVPVVDGHRILGVVSRGDFNASEQNMLEAERYLWDHLR